MANPPNVQPFTLTGDGTPMIARTESMKANRAKLRAAEKAARKVRAEMAKRRKKGNR